VFDFFCLEKIIQQALGWKLRAGIAAGMLRLRNEAADAAFTAALSTVNANLIE
jgi:hypothetical protein